MPQRVFRAKAYGFGTLAGAFGVLTVLAARRRQYRTLPLLAAALVCGLLAAANEREAAELDATDAHSAQ